MVEFADLTKEEYGIVLKIVDRAMKLGKDYGIPIDALTTQMDISATHKHCPLRLQDLAEASDEDFAHDILGIRRYMNRRTGLLTHCFVPRMSR